MKRQILFKEIQIPAFVSKLLITVTLILLAMAQIRAQQGNDSAAIDIKEFSFTPSTIDVTDSSQTVSVTIRVTDTESEIGSIEVFFVSPKANRISGELVRVRMDSQDRISGDSRDGIYRKSAVFAQNRKAGIWEVNDIEIYDYRTNHELVYTETLAALGFPTKLQVINGNDEDNPPELIDFSSTPSSINLSFGSRIVTFTLRVKDLQSGVHFIELNLGNDYDEAYFNFIDGSNRVSGDEKDGVYRKVFIVPLNARPGTYYFVVHLRDNLGNHKELYASDLSQRGFPYQLEITGTASNRTPFDFDGDGRADISVFRPTDRIWYLNRSTQGFSAIQFGLSTDKITPADFDGDGKTDIAVYRDGFWYWLNTSDGNFNAVQFGLADDIPVPADFSGDGRAELAVYRGGYWFTLDLTNNQFNAAQFGISTDKPLAADYDGDGSADFSVFRDGIWYLLQSTLGFTAVQFGLPTDKPVPSDYNGDGKTDIAVYRGGTWYLLGSQNGISTFRFGEPTDIPASADYDGDGQADAAVFRDGVWYLRQSTNGFAAVQFGLTDDKPVPAAYLH